MYKISFVSVFHLFKDNKYTSNVIFQDPWEGEIDFVKRTTCYSRRPKFKCVYVIL